MKLYRKRPVEVEAVHYTGWNVANVVGWIHTGGVDANAIPADQTIAIRTLEGVMTARPGDWIVRGVHGEFYPCKPDIFAETYEAVDNPDGAAP